MKKKKTTKQRRAGGRRKGNRDTNDVRMEGAAYSTVTMVEDMFTMISASRLAKLAIWVHIMACKP